MWFVYKKSGQTKQKSGNPPKIDDLKDPSSSFAFQIRKII